MEFIVEEKNIKKEVKEGLYKLPQKNYLLFISSK
jgi:hypothetical protein